MLTLPTTRAWSGMKNAGLGWDWALYMGIIFCVPGCLCSKFRQGLGFLGSKIKIGLGLGLGLGVRPAGLAQIPGPRGFVPVPDPALPTINLI
jgi:hypothetical protein